MIKYLITRRDTCPICQGERTVLTLLYKEFVEYMDDWSEEHPEPYTRGAIEYFDKKVAVQNEWWVKRGYPHGGAHWPKKLQRCTNCHGIGHIEQEAEFGEALISFFKDHN